MMGEISIFISYKKNDIADQKGLVSSLRKVKGVNKVAFIENDPKGNSQIEINFNHFEQFAVEDIEIILSDNGIQRIEGFSLWLTPALSHIADPYSASVVSVSFEKKMESLTGIIDFGISANGIIKIEIEPQNPGKQKIICEILKVVKDINHTP